MLWCEANIRLSPFRRTPNIAVNASSTAAGPNHVLVISATCLGIFVATYNTTATMTALPAIRSALDLGAQTEQWVVNIYMLSAAAMLAAMGRFADIFGKLRVYLVGLGTFAVGSIIIIFASEAVMMLAGRMLQGVGTAAIIGPSAALISVSTPEDKRSLALGLWAAGAALGFALGPSVGGTLTDIASWRSIFVTDVVLLALAAVMCFRIQSAGLATASDERASAVDYLGVVLLAVTMGSLLYGLTSGLQAGWTSLQTITLFAIAALCGLAFAVREPTAKVPLVDFRFFHNSKYVAGLVGMFLTGVLMMGALYHTNLFIQSPGALHFSAFQAGVALLPFTLTMFATALVAPRVLSSHSFRWPPTVAMLALAVGYWLMQDTSNQTAYTSLAWKFIILGFGAGLCYAFLPRVGLSGLPDESAGQGAGVINTCYFLGMAIGTAAGGIVTAVIKRSLLEPEVEKLSLGGADRTSLDAVLLHGSDTQIESSLERFSPEIVHDLKSAMQLVTDDAFDGVMIMMSVVALIGAVLCVLLIRGSKAPKPQA